MLRVFGSYMFGKSPEERMKGDMLALFEVKDNPMVSYSEFSSGPLFLVYERVNDPKADNYYYIDQDRDVSCFVIGNIHAYEESRLEVFLGINVAQWVVQAYQKKESFDFVKGLRGIFNIIIFDKGKLFLINDILGLSPMYVKRSADRLFFCSEAEPIIEMKDNNEIDRESIVDFFVYGLIPQGKTFVSGLENQTEATVMEIAVGKVAIKSYGEFQCADLKGMSHDEKIQIFHDTFKEGVAIRAPQEEVLADLTGGRDTRFIIANLLKLNKKITVITYDINPSDAAIARQLAKKLGLKYVDERSSSFPSEAAIAGKVAKKLGLKHFVGQSSILPKEDYFYRFQTKYGRDRDIDPCKIAFLKEQNRLWYAVQRHPKFGGQFANGLLSQPPSAFRKGLDPDYLGTAKKIFKASFLSKCKNIEKKDFSAFLNKIDPYMSIPFGKTHQYCYLTQIGRSYLNTYHGKYWARPTHFFQYSKLMPFIDSKFFSVLLSMESEYFYKYQAYNEVYERFFPELNEFPIYQAPLGNSLGVNLMIGQNPIEKAFSNNLNDIPEFKRFLKESKIIQLTPYVLTQKFSELMFFYYWFRSNQDILRGS